MLTPKKRQIIENYIDKRIRKVLAEALVQPKKEASYYTDSPDQGLEKIYDQIEAAGYFCDPDETDGYFDGIGFDDTKEGTFTLFKDGKELPTKKLVISVYHMPVPPDYEDKKAYYYSRRDTNHYGQYKTTYEVTDIV